MLAKPIIYDNWSGGIADSPHRGIAGSLAMMVGLDIHSKPGIIQISNKLEKKSGAVVTDLTKWIVPYDSSKVYALGSGQKVYYSADGGGSWADITSGSQSLGHGNGAIIWRKYLVIAGDSRIDICGPVDSLPTTWAQLDFEGSALNSDTKYHPILVGKRDGSLYFGNSKSDGTVSEIAILSEVSGKTFDPTDNTTYTFTPSAVSLPPMYRIKSLEEQGNFLMIGIWEGVNLYEFPTAIIYPWDYVLRPSNKDNPISLGECGINAQLNIGGVLYVWSGIQGNFYYFNGSSLVKLKRIPFDISGGLWIQVYPGAVANFKGIPLFGQSRGNTGSSALNIAGVYSYGSLNKNYPNVLNLPYPISAGISNATIGAICALGTNNLLIGWSQGTSTYGIDKIDTTKRYSSGSYFETLLERIGTAEHKEIIDGFNITLDIPLVVGQAIIIKFRRNTSASWTTVKIKGYTKTMAFSDIAGKSEIHVPFKINDVVNLQFRVDIETGATNATPELREVRIQ